MTQSTPPGINDLLGLFGGNNPFGVITKSIGQFQRGVSDFLSGVENFNKTMEQMHVMANRINSLLDTVEEPVKAVVPKLTRTINRADAMVEQLSAPIDRVVPGLSKLADVLASPSLTAMPKELSDFMAVLSELARRLQPLGAMAESAGGMFGLRPLAAMLGATPQPPPPKPRASHRIVRRQARREESCRSQAGSQEARRQEGSSEEGRSQESPDQEGRRAQAVDPCCGSRDGPPAPVPAPTAPIRVSAWRRRGSVRLDPASRCHGRRRPLRCRVAYWAA